METTATDKDAAAAGDDLHALRKYIVDMMHTEMELMEQIKQREENLEAATVRVHYFKDLVTQEQARNTSLRAILSKDLTDLEIMEGQKIVADAKHKQFQDAVIARENEAGNLRSAYSEVRGVILRLQQHLRRLEVERLHTSTLDAKISTEFADFLLQLEDLKQEPEIRQSELQNHRTKKTNTCENAALLEKEANDLTAKRSSIEEEHNKAESCIKVLKSSLKRSEIEIEKQRHVLQDDVCNIRNNQRIIAAKLAKKQTKFRKRTKTEIASLRRRVSFIQSELEKIQMGKEETLSVVFALTNEHGFLNDRIKKQSDEILAVEKLISDLGDKISTFDRCESKFSKSEMQQNLAIKQNQIEVIQHRLEEKQKILQQTKLASNQSIEALTKLMDEINAANTDNVDERLRIVKEELKEQEDKKTDLQEVLIKEQEKHAQMKARSNYFRRAADQSKKRILSLKKKQKTIKLGKAKLQERLTEEERILTSLLEALKTGEMLHANFLEEKDQHEKERQILENELEEQEKSWASRYLEEEAKLNVELRTWDEKINLIRDQISAL